MSKILQAQSTYYVLAALILIFVFLIGATFYSYLNEVIIRLPKKEDLTHGRSKCPHCGHAFAMKEALPIFSHLRYKGKCIYCFEPLPKRKLVIEILGGCLAVLVVCHYRISLEALLMVLLYGVLTVISFIDADTQEIPPVLNAIILGLGVIRLLLFRLSIVSFLESVIGFFCISLLLYVIVIIVPDGFGGGDIKMMAAAGFFLGWKANVFAFFIGLVMGGAYGVYLLLRKKKDKNEHFAFGPFLSIGIAISAYAEIGNIVMNQYLEPFRKFFEYM
ncbi:MAG: A24 family peptidase [Eubacteriales bacterium]|nr:A24 family peptidase [Eubacteriales bacterium]